MLKARRSQRKIVQHHDRFTNFTIVDPRPSLKEPRLVGGCVGIAIVFGAILFPDRVDWEVIILGWAALAGLVLLLYVLIRPPLILNANSTKLSDTDILELLKLKKIACLRLSGAAISPSGFQALATLPAVEELDLSETNLTDEESGFLGSMKGLELLSLDNTQITDATLEHLKGMTSLRCVTLEGTGVTEEGKEKLRKSIFGLFTDESYWN